MGKVEDLLRELVGLQAEKQTVCPMTPWSMSPEQANL